LLVEHLARVTQTADVDAHLFQILIAAWQVGCGRTGFVIVAPACDSARQIEHMEFDRGMTQQMGEVGESPSVFEPNGAIAVTNRPILTLFAENPIY
jgi:hypothetical protein